MSDPRTTPCNGRVAHVDLKGQVEAKAFVVPLPMQVNVAKKPLCRTPTGPMDREVLCGEIFQVLEWPDADPNGWAYGYLERDGYCGYVHSAFLHEAVETTHRVNVRETYRQNNADLKSFERKIPLYFGSRLTVVGREGDWSEIVLRLGGRESARESRFFVPSHHLIPVDHLWTDPVAVARLFIGTPYVWGGNAGNGLDCSGLVQAAFLTCGIPCPGDSDLQEQMTGAQLDEVSMLEPGDLIFWNGHVALVSGENAIIHANAHHMAVVEEPMDAAIARIAITDTGPVTSMLRVSRPPE